MRNFIFIFIAALCAVCLNAAGCSAETLSGKNETRGYAVETDYSSLKVSGSITASFSGTADSVYVTADESVIDYVKIEWKGEELSLSLKSPVKFRHGGYGLVTVVLPCNPALDRVYVSGASSLSSQEVLEADTFRAEISGASEFDAGICAGKAYLSASGASVISGRIEAASLDVVLTGASDARLCGKAGTCTLSLSGASSLKGLSDNWIETDTAVCDLSGASSARIICNKSISGEVSGASDLCYKGDAERNVHVSGASSVKKR